MAIWTYPAGLFILDYLVVLNIDALFVVGVLVLEDEKVFVHERIEDAIENADVIEVLRIQLERMKGGLFPTTREYARVFGLNTERLKLAKNDVLILHPGPMNKGWEISNDVAYSLNSAIQPEVENGVAVRMALYKLLLV